MTADGEQGKGISDAAGNCSFHFHREAGLDDLGVMKSAKEVHE
jgi:hypothetical protein